MSLYHKGVGGKAKESHLVDIKLLFEMMHNDLLEVECE